MSQETACQNAELLAQSTLYKILLMTKLLASALAVPIFVALAMIKLNTKIFHPNTRVIALFVCVLVLLIAVSNIGFYIFEMWRVSYPYTDPCDRLLSTRSVFAYRSIVTILSNGCSSCLVVLCIERIVCICRISNYEQSTRPVLVSVFLLGITVISSVAFVFLYSQGVDWDRQIAITTARNSKNGASYQIMLIYLQAVEFSGDFFFLFIRYWSLWYRTRIRGFTSIAHRSMVASIRCTQTLSVKFQIEETIQVTTLFLPIVLLKCFLIMLSIFLASAFNTIWPNPATDTQMVLYEIASMSYFSPLCIGLLLAYSTNQFKRIFCLSAKRQATVFVGVSENQDDHFNRLKQMFEK
ncbi:serpentine type 7TM GPCR receptor class ab chemoreceptor domain-containing protein [Ditylenchus destructor]|nr:serpentine type 7TM GPCR receptor class ab chemoreceptor domain-containing protein [Ditylenchus destructor]